MQIQKRSTNAVLLKHERIKPSHDHFTSMLSLTPLLSLINRQTILFSQNIFKSQHISIAITTYLNVIIAFDPLGAISLDIILCPGIL